MVVREAHDLAAADGRTGAEDPCRVGDVGTEGGDGVRREAVLEDDDLVVALGDLRRHRAVAGRAERALVLGRHEGAVLAVRGHRHPVVDEGVVARLARLDARLDRARIHGRPLGRPGSST